MGAAVRALKRDHMTTSENSPTVSVLVPTFNRANLLPRAVKSVLAQDFKDFEVIVLDDCSQDKTPDVVHGFGDPRVRYIRNEVNQGAQHGDRAHVHRTLYQLMNGRYFVCLCDDDFWLPKDLLSRQVTAFERHPGLSMALGGHAHIHPRPMKKLATSGDMVYQIVPEVSETTYHAHNLFPSGFMKGRKYLNLFAEDPFPRNILNGATLLSREAVFRARAFASEKGARWQGGYEFTIGPALVGDVFYIDEPCVVATVDPQSASYRGSQRTHFLDCLASVNAACDNARPSLAGDDVAFMERIRRRFIHQITIGFLINRIAFKMGWYDGAAVNPASMFADGVTTGVALHALRDHGIGLSMGNLSTLALANMPGAVLRASAKTLETWDRRFGQRLPLKRRTLLGLRRAPGEFGRDT